MSGVIANALTVDVEDYFQVSAFASTIGRDEWENHSPRVEPNTHRILDRFSERGISATFFMLGWVAERFPQLVREIAARGHEVACHGYSHRLIYNQSPEGFRAETLRAKNLLEEQVQQPVLGYRAASYSITSHSLWALDILAEAGFAYDSSIFPVRHDRYGMPKAPTLPYCMSTTKGHRLVEFPLSTVNVLGYRLPMAGGGYFRLYPYWFTQTALRSINRRGQPFVFYLHPWEIDPAQPRIQAPWLSRFRHYNNLKRCEDRLERLLGRFSFTTAKVVLDDLGMWQQAPVPVTEHV